MKLNSKNILLFIKNNKYIVVFIVFLIWILFLDTNSWLKHRELDKSIEKLEDRKEFYQNEISKDRKALDELDNNPEKLEKYARERFLMKKKNEDIFIIKEENK
ncbi:MAG: septum formation initiator family protein [Flavobacteriales bacterium]|nr:septum formation initiator family protein [Flavobacteriales bacterium]